MLLTVACDRPPRSTTAPMPVTIAAAAPDRQPPRTAQASTGAAAHDTVSVGSPRVTACAVSTHIEPT